jgi:hypothetical protein
LKRGRRWKEEIRGRKKEEEARELVAASKPMKGSVLKQQLVRLLTGSGFPKPWQMLSEANKAQLTERLPDAMAVLEVRKALCVMEWGEWNPAGFGLREFREQVVEQVGPGPVITVALAVNLAAGRVAIEREFRRWLDRELRRARKLWGEVEGMKKNEISQLEYFRFKAPGPTGWRTALNQLGALRWRHYARQCGLKFQEAKALSDWKKALPFVYRRSDQSSFNRACKGAIQRLAKLFPNERPIHRY